MKPLITYTTWRREIELVECLNHHAKYSKGIDIFVYSDDKDNPVGISKAKNACIREFMAGDYTHLFMFDDDSYPIKNGWHELYTQSELNHACYTFYRPKKRHKTHNEYRLSNGCMIYMTRGCVETSGGMDVDLYNKYEHKLLSENIYAWGLTPCPFLDVPNSSEYLYCKDQDNGFKRSFDNKTLKRLLDENRPIYHEKKNKLPMFFRYK